jgi:hypothetical protein
VLDCYVLHYYLSWYCHLAMERGVYMDELQPIQDYNVWRQALHLLVQISHRKLECINHEIQNYEVKKLNLKIRIQPYNISTCTLLVVVRGFGRCYQFVAIQK